MRLGATALAGAGKCLTCLPMHPDDRLFGEIAIKLGMVQRQALAPLVKVILARPGEMAQVLVEAGLLSEEQAVTVGGHLDRIVRERQSAAGPDASTFVPRVVREPQRPEQTTPAVDVPRVPSRSALEVASASDPSRLRRILADAVARGASDVHVHSGAPILMRNAGRLETVAGEEPLAAEAAEEMIAGLLSAVQRRRLLEVGQVDFACAVAGLARFRCSAYRQHRGTDLVLRVIPEQRRSLADLGLPAALGRLLDFRTGLVLCTGPTGSGKSTTLAALLDALIGQRKEHVITLEDPIEHVFQAHVAWVNQREVESHTQSFARALRSALREDPDVIVITELRDRETIGLALTAAETGHLVLCTVNTNSAGQTISRVVNAFPGDEQGHVRSMLSESLRAVISQRLVPTVDGRGRVPAVELLIGTTAVANTIRDDKTFQLPSLMQTGSAMGMITLDDSLFGLVEAGKIRKAEAYRLATTKERFKQ